MNLFSSDKLEAMSLHALFVHELHDLYDAEHQILDALPAMIEHVTEPELKKALNHHLRETQEHVSRLEKVFESIQEKPQRMTCDGMKGLIKEGEHVLHGDMDPTIMDEAIIGAAQRVEHYEIAGYGTAREHAKAMGHTEAVKLLDATLQEEGTADKTLTQIAKTMYKEVAKMA